MGRKLTPVNTLRRRRRRLLNRLEPLLQLDLFLVLDDATAKAIAELKAAVAKTAREINEGEPRAA
jgi:hypothetical protein